MPLEGSLEALSLLSSAEFRVCTKPGEAWELPGGANEQCRGWDTSGKQEGIPDLDTERAKRGQKPKGACVFSKSLRWAHITLAKNDSLTSQLCATELEAPREDTVPGSWTVICPTGHDGPGLALNKGLIRNSCSLQRRLQKRH